METEPRDEAAGFEIWAIGGGKGGTGKSAITAAVGFQLSRLGKRVVLVDADFGSANLHTCLGLGQPARSLLEFLRGGGSVIDEYAVATPYPNLRLIGGRVDEGVGSLPTGWPSRLSTALRALSVDIALVDLGAGVSLDTVDTMNLADRQILVVVPEPTSVENVISLLRSLSVQRLIQRVPSNEVRRRLVALQAGSAGGHVKTAEDFFREIEQVDPGLVGAARAVLGEMALALLTNQVRDEADRKFGAQMAAVIQRHFSVPMAYAGFVHHDDAVWRTLRRGEMFMVEASRSRAAEDVRRLTRNLLRRADQSPVF